MLQHVYSPRDWGQGFARPGMIVMSEGRVLRALEEDPKTSFLKGNAHEAAHFWWRDGFGQGDWINETFAEYFALLALRAEQGERPFRNDLEEKREAVRALPEDAPAIAVVPNDNSGDGYTIRYDKGALMLEAFREHLGDEIFSRACRGFCEAIRGRKAGTADFRAYWSAVLGDDVLLGAWLDLPGSRPVPSGD
jgi:aminopeptidase N